MKKRFLKTAGIPFAVMLAGYFLLVLVDLIPTAWIEKNVRRSSQILLKEGTYPAIFLRGTFLDNYTDADCIGIVYNKKSDNPFFNAIKAFHLGSGASISRSIEGLHNSITGEGIFEDDHSYLWHGFQIWLRPLLTGFNIREIRAFHFVITILLSTIVCILLNEIRKNNRAFLPFIVGFTFFFFQLESLCLLFYNDFLVMLIGCITLLLLIQQNKNCVEEVFPAVGSAVAFTSMLIMPLLTLGFPLVIYVSVKQFNSEKEKIRKTLQCILSWCWGYAVTMVSKILLTFILLRDSGGILRLSIYGGVSRNPGGRNINLFHRFERLINVFSRIGPIRIFLIVLLLCLCIICIFIKSKDGNCRKSISAVWPFLLIAFFPCLWCLGFAGHAHHGWTCFNFSISVFALMEILWKTWRFNKATQ